LAKTILQDRIKQWLAAKKTRKVIWLIARDISARYKEKPVAGQQEEEEAGRGPAGLIEEDPSSIATESTASESTADGTQNSKAEAVGGQRPIPYESSAVPPGIAEDGSGAGANLALGTVMENAGGERVDDSRVKEVEDGVVEPSRKRRRLAADGVRDEKRRKLGVAISVVNLDLEKGLEELKWNVTGVLSTWIYRRQLLRRHGGMIQVDRTGVNACWITAKMY